VNQLATEVLTNLLARRKQAKQNNCEFFTHQVFIICGKRIYTKTAGWEKSVRLQNARVKKDVKSKVVAKKWL